MAPDAVAEAGAIRRRSVLVVVSAILVLVPVAVLDESSRIAQASLTAAWVALMALLVLTIAGRSTLQILERGVVAVLVIALTGTFWGKLTVAGSGVGDLVEVATHFGPPNAIMAGAAVFLIFGPRAGLWFSLALSLSWMVLVAVQAARLDQLGELFGEVDHLLDALLAYVVTIALLWALTRQNLTWATGEAAARDLALHDPLTGLPNRRLALRRLGEALDGLAGDGDLVVAMVDLDHFKSINDEHGHEVGDAALQAVGQTLELQIRDGDLAARWGGEEFLLVLTGSPLPQAVAAAERCRVAIEAARPRRNHDRWFPNVTASFGLAVARHGDTMDDLIRRADQQLFLAKESGRNCVFSTRT